MFFVLKQQKNQFKCVISKVFVPILKFMDSLLVFNEVQSKHVNKHDN